MQEQPYLMPADIAAKKKRAPTLEAGAQSSEARQQSRWEILRGEVEAYCLAICGPLARATATLLQALRRASSMAMRPV